MKMSRQPHCAHILSSLSLRVEGREEAEVVTSYALVASASRTGFISKKKTQTKTKAQKDMTFEKRKRKTKKSEWPEPEPE